ncbi:MAG: YdaS family helix-turn-helix protein [Thiomonas delicata]
MSTNIPLSEAITAHGGLSACARMIGVRPPTMHQWIKGLRPVPPRRCYAIESALAVRRWDLRPDDWHLIWPELVGTEGAPSIATSASGAVQPQEDGHE